MNGLGHVSTASRFGCETLIEIVEHKLTTIGAVRQQTLLWKQGPLRNGDMEHLVQRTRARFQSRQAAEAERCRTVDEVLSRV